MMNYRIKNLLNDHTKKDCRSMNRMCANTYGRITKIKDESHKPDDFDFPQLGDIVFCDNGGTIIGIYPSVEAYIDDSVALGDFEVEILTNVKVEVHLN